MPKGGHDMTHRAAFLGITVAILSSLVFPLIAQQTKSAQQAKKDDPDNLRLIYEEDQKDRSNIDDASIARDAKRKEQIRRLLSEGKVQSGDDYFYAAMVYQHGQTPSDYLFAHVLAVTAAEKGSKLGVWLSAATLDRYLRSINQPQIFGTQFGSDRPEGGPYTQEPYDKDMISDSLRATWCVAPIAVQASILKDVNAGKEFRSTRNCPID